MNSHITAVTRRRIIRSLTGVSWFGDLDEVTFLERLFPIDELPSYDGRYTTAREDIVQHCIANYDWPEDWIFTDDRFGLSHDDAALLGLLAEMLHPAVRDDSAEATRLAASLNELLVQDRYEIVQVDDISGAPIFAGRRMGGGVPGAMKNLIFAADGPKPEIVLEDALNNDVRIVRNEQFCLVYDRPLSARGLTWADLCTWWAERQNLTTQAPREVSLDLHNRLRRCLDNDAERLLLHTYARRYARLGAEIPALLPQVYLHYDPYSAAQRASAEFPLVRQRMDFLLLLPQRIRIVIELDGKQHYADRVGRADTRRYAEMVAEDRDLRLRGYEVYRFGGAELVDKSAGEAMLSSFFDRLATRYGR